MGALGIGVFSWEEGARSAEPLEAVSRGCIFTKQTPNKYLLCTWIWVLAPPLINFGKLHYSFRLSFLV